MTINVKRALNALINFTPAIEVCAGCELRVQNCACPADTKGRRGTKFVEVQ